MAAFPLFLWHYIVNNVSHPEMNINDSLSIVMFHSTVSTCTQVNIYISEASL